jgi:cytoskeletal protein CcmA (bactofilin family)
MALFPAQQEKPRNQAQREPGLSIIAAGMRVEGELISDGVVKIEGTLVGTVRAEQQVLVARGGVVDGDIYTREAVVGGEVRGGIFADERVEVQATSVVQGDIATQRITVQEGGEVNGHIKMGTALAAAEGADASRSRIVSPEVEGGGGVDNE